MARTRQKAKQRKAKRLEQERKAAERAQGEDGSAQATAEALAEVEEARREAAAETQEAQRAAEVATAPEVTPVPARETAPEKVARRERRKAEVAKKEKAKAPARAERKREVRPRGRVANFFVQVWAELRRVQWPNRSQVTQATAVVIVFCGIAGAYLALWDYFFNKLIKALL
jgi:preprotein translocase subunit SecE